jgi:hypothetical protein
MGKTSTETTLAYPVIAPGALLTEPDKTPYAAYWAAADPDSFRPKL